jgi:DNA polymerase I-like protein with 3'-5' exonuclease and polymerase domains
MEYNGFLFDCKAAKEASTQLEKEAAQCDAYLYREFPDIPLNIGSPNHISSILYGGEIKGVSKVPIGYYKTGARAGEVKYTNFEQTYTLPRIIEPLKGSEQAKEGYYGTSEDILRSLKSKGRVGKIIDTLLDRRGIEKLRGTYYDGIPNLIAEHHWENSIVHGQFNQCVAITGRLSSTKPNQQNLPGGCKKFCISRYA